jgi:hypothetical protein
MRIIDARWTPIINLLIISCDCGRQFEHRADRWTVRCNCGRTQRIDELRQQWLWEYQKGE